MTRENALWLVGFTVKCALWGLFFWYFFRLALALFAVWVLFGLLKSRGSKWRES